MSKTDAVFRFLNYVAVLLENDREWQRMPVSVSAIRNHANCRNDISTAWLVGPLHYRLKLYRNDAFF